MLKSKRSCSKYLVLKTKDIFVIRGRWKYRPVSDILFLAFSEHKKAVYFFALLSLNDSILGPFAFFERSVSVNRSIISVNLILKPKIFFDIILNFQPRYSWIYLNEIFEKKPSEALKIVIFVWTMKMVIFEWNCENKCSLLTCHFFILVYFHQK